MADELAVRREAYDDRRKALTDCTNRLSAKDRELLALRYTESMRAPEIASRLGRTSVAIRQALFRVRAALKRCIDSKMTAT
jgi:RNA polymerase sigma-70 factor (ECF subfamily)